MPEPERQAQEYPMHEAGIDEIQFAEYAADVTIEFPGLLNVVIEICGSDCEMIEKFQELSEAEARAWRLRLAAWRENTAEQISEWNSNGKRTIFDKLLALELDEC